MISLFSGLLAGLIHVFSGPDHLAAVAPLAVQDRSRAWLTGCRWGLGHAGGVMAVGLCSLLLRGLLPGDLISSWSERFVGVVIIGIGLWGLRKAFTQHVHAHEHTHDGQTHLHIHVHGRHTAHAPGEARLHAHTHAAFAVGTFHGLAGSSHFLGVLPALALPANAQAVAYLAAYGVGTVVAMASFASVVGLLAHRFSYNGTKAYRALMGGCSAAAVAVGAYWLASS